ncbi:MAG: DNA internalization-related competence protein ComEC/Rec2 [Syntrophales bacterium]|jgi:competence protein ComEC|nr:DNA internalization-related competence protein ComEC/Rec2 [Syntrophales bacterium]
MARPLIAPLLSLMAGIVCSSLLMVPDNFLLSALLAVLILLLWSRLKRRTNAALFLLCCALFFCGWLQMNTYLYQPPGKGHIIEQLRSDPVTIEGVIVASPLLFPEKTDLMIAAYTLTDGSSEVFPVHGKVLLSFRGTQAFEYGDVVRVRTRLRKVRNFHNPGGFNYERYLRFQGVLLRGSVVDDSRIVVIRKGYGNPIRQKLEGFRSTIRTFIDTNAPAPEKEIIKACILGDQQQIPRELRDAFSKTGISHIIAISGFNMSMIAFFSIYLVRGIIRRFPYLLLRFDLYKLSVLFAMPPVILYTFIAGAGMSVLRATLMILAFMAALLIAKSRDLYNTLAMAALIILLVYPPALFDVSFQLSFAAVLAILLITPRLTALIPKPEPVPGSPFSLPVLCGKGLYAFALFIIVSVSAMLGTMPLIAFYFNRVSVISLLANIIIVPILGILAIPVSMATIFFLPFSSLVSAFFLDIAGTLVMISLALNNFFASLPWAAFYLTTPSLLELLFFYVFLYGLTRRLAHLSSENGTDNDHGNTSFLNRLRSCPTWIHYMLAASVIFFCLDAVYLHQKNSNRGDFTATAIDVGQGSSILVRFPGDQIMLIDGGGFINSTFDVGKYIVAPYLWHERLNSIDIVVLTHPHPDHLNGLPFILDNFPVREVWINGEISGSEEYLRFQDIIKSKGLLQRSMNAGNNPVVIDGVRIEFFNPPGPVSRQEEETTFTETNDESLVMRMTYGEVSFLFPGDISAMTEERLASDSRKLRSQLLFVPHHGGRTSTSEAFLQRVRPQTAIISVGADNLFRLPHPDVLKRLNQRGAITYRTDLHGAVTASTDGLGLSIYPYQPITTGVVSQTAD